MRVASIHTYPVKGCYRIDQRAGRGRAVGPARRPALAHRRPRDGQAITQRETPGLTQIRPRAEAGGLLAAYRRSRRPGVTEPAGRRRSRCTVWRFDGPAAVAGAAADDWLTAVLDRKVRLVWLDDPTRRPVNPDYGRPGDTGQLRRRLPGAAGQRGSLAAPQRPDRRVRFAGGSAADDPVPAERRHRRRRGVDRGRLDRRPDPDRRGRRSGCRSRAAGAWSPRPTRRPANAARSRCARWPATATSTRPCSSPPT